MPPQNANDAVPEKQEIKENGYDYTKDRSYVLGKYLAHPESGDEIVVTGLSGQFPDSDNVYAFRDNLYNKIDMVSLDTRRWDHVYAEVPQRGGKINRLSKFDAGFFGIHEKQATVMDPLVKSFLECAVECIFDAGLHPKDLEGANCGVFVGACHSETEKCWFHDDLVPKGMAITGCERSMLANRVSYYLKLDGPSFICDTACSSSLYALEQAFKAIRSGEIDSAIVGGANLCLHPCVSLQFARLGVLSPDGACKCFDSQGNGYARSEAISAVLLQKAKDAKRVYCRLIHSKVNCDGYKEQGITFPSGEMQKRLLTEFYQECEVNPHDLSYLEAHGTGTKVGDPEEVLAIDGVFCQGRDSPLLIGSVKSSIGHSEPSSGLCSLTKVILALESGVISPNLYYKTPREGLTALEEGRLKVVTENTPIEDDRALLGINSFGFGGGNCHVLTQLCAKEKINKGLPSDNLPRLVCVSGRVDESITSLLDDVTNRCLDAEFVALLHNIFRYDIDSHVSRGYTIAAKNGEIKRHQTFFSGNRRKLYLVFGGVDNSWHDIGNHLFSVPIFAASIQKIHNILSQADINISEILLNNKHDTSLSNSVLGSLAVQIGLADVIKTIGLKPDGIFGHSIGELVCAYFDDALTLQQVVVSGHAIANALKVSIEPASNLIVDLEEKEVRKILPADVSITSVISKHAVLISGKKESVLNVINTMKNKNITFTDAGISGAYIKKENVEKVKSTLLSQLSKVITKPKARSQTWLSSSSVNVASSEYFVDSIIAPTYYSQLINQMAQYSVILEAGASPYTKELQPYLDCKDISIQSLKEDNDNNPNYVVSLLDTLGRLYNIGFNFNVDKIYPKVQFPVSRGTPMISPLIKWNHKTDWWTFRYQPGDICTKTGLRSVQIYPNYEEWSIILGHVIDGRNLYPASGYLDLVLDTYTRMTGGLRGEVDVVFENVKFLRATPVSLNTVCEMLIIIQKGSGHFEVVEQGTPVVTGRIFAPTESDYQVDIPKPEKVLPDEFVMNSKDIYKDLRLRGYNYKNEFKSIAESNIEGTRGLIKWSGNWITFIDNMFQLKILSFDSRLLYVPIGIDRLSIEAKTHIEYVQKFGDTALIPTYVLKDCNIIQCGGIEVRGLRANSIPKKKPLGEPVLEKYIFIPNDVELKKEESLRVNMQILMENFFSIRVKAVEVIDEATNEESEPLAPLICQVLGDLPLVQVDMNLFTKKELEIKGVTVQDKKLVVETDCTLVVGSNILKRAQMLQHVFGSLKENGFAISREDKEFDISKINTTGIDIVTIHKTEQETLIFFRKSTEFKTPKLVDVTDPKHTFAWLPNLQKAIKNDTGIIVYAQNEPLSGVIGLVNCLRREPEGGNTRCLFVIDEDAPKFDLENPCYLDQLKKNLAINIYKDGKWGTYRHLLLDSIGEAELEHCFANAVVKGDLSSLRWIEGPLSSNMSNVQEKELVTVYYSALNFRDIMTASGRIQADVISLNRLEQECIQGMEFSGRMPNGQRVMGICNTGACANLILADSYMKFDCPDHWTLEEAVTVPVVYLTVLAALTETCTVTRGESILIHCGAGGVGLAAISIAHWFGCRVYTTVGTPEKREFIKKQFPQLQDHCIFNSRDTTFEQQLMTQTNGRGVDYVLNSLADEKLMASVRCLAPGGKFLEIGKFDLANNTALKLALLERGASYHSITLDLMFAASPGVKFRMYQMLMDGIEAGAVKPLHTHVFQTEELEQAFRFMAAGKHIGKIVIKLRKEEQEKVVLPKKMLMKGVPRYICKEENTYIICGGLGGFGLELADWLIIRGARKLVLTSRNGVRTGYQAKRIKSWSSYGATIVVSDADITTREGCVKLIQQANDFGPVEAIFNLAVVLKDALLENQSVENYQISFAPKADATKYLDEVTREMCPHLRDFVIFSSVSCGRGNAGQTNYGMANSVMERICEKRREDGLPALAIEWGAVGDVGLVAEMQEEHTQMEIGGTLQQRISSCLQVMDTFMKQKNPIVSSMVVAEKRAGAGNADNIVDAVANILGLKDLKTVSLHATLAELGMDSITAVEIKQTLDREFEVFLTPQDIRSMTFARLQEIEAEREAEQKDGKKRERIPGGIELIFRMIGDEATANIPVIRLPSMVEPRHHQAPELVLIPGVEGVAHTYIPLAKNLNCHAMVVQYCYENTEDTLNGIAEHMLPHVEKHMSNKNDFRLVGYSFGSVLTLEIAGLLEKKGYTGTVIIIDGSPDWVLEMISQQVNVNQEDAFQTGLICAVMNLYVPIEIVMKSREKIFKCNTFEDRVNMAKDCAPADTPYSAEYQRSLSTGLYKRAKGLLKYQPCFSKLKSTVKLFKPQHLSVKTMAEDYNLSKFCEKPIEVRVFDGNHISILNNLELADAIHEELGLEKAHVKEEVIDEEVESEKIKLDDNNNEE